MIDLHMVREKLLKFYAHAFHMCVFLNLDFLDVWDDITIFLCKERTNNYKKVTLFVSFFNRNQAYAIFVENQEFYLVTCSYVNDSGWPSDYSNSDSSNEKARFLFWVDSSYKIFIIWSGSIFLSRFLLIWWYRRILSQVIFQDESKN